MRAASPVRTPAAAIVEQPNAEPSDIESRGAGGRRHIYRVHLEAIRRVGLVDLRVQHQVAPALALGPQVDTDGLA